MKQDKSLSRRELLIDSAVITAGISLGGSALANMTAGMPSPSRKKVSANDKIVFGLIGCHGMGAANMRNLMQHEDVEFAAICDVDFNRVADDFKHIETTYGRKPEVFRDYRKMLERKDIDAIIVGSPDHWHALNLIHSVEAGKDVYCEKPISHNFTEAKAMVAAKNHFKKVVQVGTWQRSTREFHDAIEYIRSGKLGKILHCRAWISDGTKLGNQQPKPVPADFDYDMWTGPAEFKPYKENMTHYMWRWVKNTGGGLTTDWGVHMMDIALLGMSKDQNLVMPKQVNAYGGQWAFPGDDRDAADTIESLLQFDDFVMTWSVLRDRPGKPDHGTEFVSTDGRTLRVWRGGWTILDPSGKELPKEQAAPLESDHWRNFLDCVKSREKPRADLDSVAQTTMCCHLSNMALYSGKAVEFDPVKQEVKGKNGKDTIAYNRKYRKGYSLKMYK